VQKDEGIDSATRGAPSLYGHSVRDALMALIERDQSTTSTIAARALGESTGTCSFHLRQLASYGLIEPVPDVGGRSKPWRLAARDATDQLNRELEDAAYASWLKTREHLPSPSNSDVGFSEVLSLSPQQVWELRTKMQRIIQSIAERPKAEDSTNVAVVVRAFPLLESPINTFN
jgi:hypothetical protein